MSTKLFVGNLSFNTTENEIAGGVRRPRHGRRSEPDDGPDERPLTRFCVRDHVHPEEAQKAIEAMNGANLGDRALTVNIARPKEERPRGDRGPRREYGGGGGAWWPPWRWRRRSRPLLIVEIYIDRGGVPSERRPVLFSFRFYVRFLRAALVKLNLIHGRTH